MTRFLTRTAERRSPKIGGQARWSSMRGHLFDESAALVAPDDIAHIALYAPRVGG